MLKQSFHNGISLFAYPTNETAFMELVIPIGSYNDSELPGISHFLEHMLIKPFEDEKDLKHSIHGLTNFDRTTYRIIPQNESVTIDSSFRYIIDILSGMKLNPSYLEAVRTDILREFRLKEKNAKELGICKIVFQNPNIKWPLGTLECINQITYEQVRTHYEKHYEFSNFGLGLIGFTNYERLLPSIRVRPQIVRNPPMTKESISKNLRPAYIYYVNSEIFIIVHHIPENNKKSSGRFGCALFRIFV